MIRRYGPTISILLIWLSFFLFLAYTPLSPITSIGTDSVSPAKVRAGEFIYVTRSYRVSQDEFVRVSRMMVKGDCKIKCDKVSLPGTDMLLTTGEYINNTVPHIIPLTAQPGVWRLEFNMHWQDSIGRLITTPLPELQIEVIP